MFFAFKIAHDAVAYRIAMRMSMRIFPVDRTGETAILAGGNQPH